MENAKEKINRIIDEFNIFFEELYGYRFCRCYFCIFDIIIKVFNECKRSNVYSLLEKTLQDINSDYLSSADYKMRKNIKSGLVCGNDCVHYEERVDACPIIFWEIDKKQLPYLIALLENRELISFFNELRGYDIGTC
jgi:hypothetical protein